MNDYGNANVAMGEAVKERPLFKDVLNNIDESISEISSSILMINSGLHRMHDTSAPSKPDSETPELSTDLLGELRKRADILMMFRMQLIEIKKKVENLI